MKKKSVCLVLMLVMASAASVKAQVTIGSLSDPNPGALLDLKELSDEGNVTATKGFILPRVYLTNLEPKQGSGREGLPASIGNDENVVWNRTEHIGLMVYNVGPCPGIYVWTGSKWQNVSGDPDCSDEDPEVDDDGDPKFLPFSNGKDDDEPSAIDKIRKAKANNLNSCEIKLLGGDENVAFDALTDLGTTGLVLNAGNSPADVTLDGGGHGIILTGNPSGNPLISVGPGVSLTLKNIYVEGLSGNNKSRNSAPLIKVAGGELILDNTSLLHNYNNSSDGEGGGVYILGHGILTMTGGSAINYNHSKKGGGVYVYDGMFIMTEDAAIVANESEQGGGVYVAANGSLSMESESSSIRFNRSDKGGGVYVADGTFYLSGGEIASNEADEGGGVLLAYPNQVTGSFRKAGGVIYGRYPDREESNRSDTGTAIAVTINGTLTKWRDDTAYRTDDGGDGTDLYFGPNNDGTDDYPNFDLKQGIWVESAGNWQPLRRFSGVSGKNDSMIDYLKGIRRFEEEPINVTLVLEGVDEEVAFSNLTDLSEAGWITSEDDHIVIDGHGKVIDLTGSPAGSPLITVNSGCVLTLKDVTFKGLSGYANSESHNNAPLIAVFGGELILEYGAKIKDNFCEFLDTFSGGGIFVAGGTLTMNGGEISGNTVVHEVRPDFGAGVYVERGTFNMTGGFISRNRAKHVNGEGFDLLGAGVYLTSDATFSKAGDGLISGIEDQDQANGFEGIFDDGLGDAVFYRKEAQGKWWYRNTSVEGSDALSTNNKSGWAEIEIQH
jgi:hypothetical protein